MDYLSHHVQMMDVTEPEWREREQSAHVSRRLNASSAAWRPTLFWEKKAVSKNEILTRVFFLNSDTGFFFKF